MLSLQLVLLQVLPLLPLQPLGAGAVARHGGLLKRSQPGAPVEVAGTPNHHAANSGGAHEVHIPSRTNPAWFCLCCVVLAVSMRPSPSWQVCSSEGWAGRVGQWRPLACQLMQPNSCAPCPMLPVVEVALRFDSAAIGGMGGVYTSNHMQAMGFLLDVCSIKAGLAGRAMQVSGATCELDHGRRWGGWRQGCCCRHSGARCWRCSIRGNGWHHCADLWGFIAGVDVVLVPQLKGVGVVERYLHI